MQPLAFATQLARRAGAFLLDKFQTTGSMASVKPDCSAVTEADVATDRLIAAAIQEQFPNDQLLSEELQPAYTGDTGPFSQAVWVIDPLDGTSNFALGLHIWGVLLARLVSGLPETAAMYFPVVDELYTAQRGQGAFLNGQPLHVQPPDPQRPFSFFACCSRTFRHYQVKIPYKARILGSAAYSLCMVARGAAVLGFEATPKMWDIAAPWLLVQEAGGILQTLDGSRPFPIQLGQNYAAHSFPTLAASTPELAARASQQIVLKKHNQET
ncbi:MAG: inositol monophosphatase family protein [Chloroflexota bacterium]